MAEPNIEQRSIETDSAQGKLVVAFVKNLGNAVYRFGEALRLSPAVKDAHDVHALLSAGWTSAISINCRAISKSLKHVGVERSPEQLADLMLKSVKLHLACERQEDERMN